ncbi:hypothetical protein MKX01_016810 [Papaver californicum]|nr:hypothetical protein MKX01_016810 [Papaver californicum]
METSFILVSMILTFVLVVNQVVNSDPVEDKQALLDFLSKTPHSRTLNWEKNSTVCNHWTGVHCSSDKSRIISLRLPGIGLNGQIPPNTLSRLTALQILSLRSNGLTGSFPSDFINLKNLSLLYLQFNKFSGSLPNDFSIWKNLTIINLSHNSFVGTIPFSLSNLTHLQALNLANNSLSGEIPDFNLPNVQQLNLANNSLTGIIPKSLQAFPKYSFYGNHVSYVNASAPIDSYQSPIIPIPPKSTNSRKLSEAALLGIIIGGSVLLILIIFGFVLLVCCYKRDGESGFSGKLHKGLKSQGKTTAPGSQDGNGRLVFFEGCNYAFDLEDLLTASAEVLGKGTFGTAYKAVLEDATTVVVKRLKEVGVGKREFEQQLEVVGRVHHENVVQLRAYYYSKDERLMVYDFYNRGSVSALLHGKRGGDRVPLDWNTRLGIAIGAARGVAHIHTQNYGKLVHGNLKSSNMFLNSQNYGLVSDLGLTTLMNPVPPPISRAAAYRAPEVVDTRKAAQPSDVYSYGVVLLELLTGKSPVHTTGGDEVIHLVRWVQSVVREEWTAEVFDIELMRYPNIEEEMVEMLQIAMSCVVRSPEQRPKMSEVVKMVEDIRRADTDIRTSSESSTPPPPPTTAGGY